jgi:hypothetical protein
MFNAYSQYQPYNVPTGQIRPQGNSININSGGQEDRGAAFEAYSRLLTPTLEQFDRSWMRRPDGMLIARPGNSPSDPFRYNPNASQYQAPDFSSVIKNMFQQVEDSRMLSDYFDLPNFR